MKKILIFSLAYFPKHVGGAEIALKEKTDRMKEFEFHMVTLRYDSSLPAVEKIGNILVHRIGFTRPNPTMADLRKFPLHLNKYFFQVTAAVKALSLHRKYHYDALWAMMAHSCGIPAAIFKLFRPRVPVVLELQEGDPSLEIEHLMRPVWPLFRRAFISPDVISVISTYLGKWARRRGFKGPVELVPNGVDVAHYAHEVPREELWKIKEGLGKREGSVYLVTSSRLVKKNAVDDVIKALPYLKDNVHFVVIGTGPDEKVLRALAKETGVAGRVHFVGSVPHHEMLKYLKACDIFVRPSLSEGFGISFIEAMAAGIPVIATQEGGIADFLFDPGRNPDKNPTGRAVAPRHPEAIAWAAKLYMEDKETTRAIVQNAREMVFSLYDWETVTRGMKERVFDRIFAR